MINNELIGLGELFKEIVMTPRGEYIKSLFDRPGKDASPLARRERRDLDYLNLDPVCRDIDECEVSPPTRILVDDDRGGFTHADMVIVQYAGHPTLEGRWRRRMFFKCKGKRPKNKEQIEEYVAANGHRGFIFGGTAQFYDHRQFSERNRALMEEMMLVGLPPSMQKMLREWNEEARQRRIEAFER